MKPLDGIRVLDVSRVVSGPVCCYFLAALGAEVIRVEAPGGDLTWRVPPFVSPEGVHRGDRGPRDIGLSPLRKGRGKQSVVLDLELEAGREIFRKLAARSDVVVENAVPGVMARRGLDYDDLAPSNPGLVYASITGYGHDGPYRDRPSMDLVVQAMSGLMAKTGFPDGPPTKVGTTIGDQVPSLFAALGILAALRQRDVDGRGQRVDVAMLDALVTLLWDEPLDEFARQGVPDRVGNGDPRGAPVGTYATRDGWVAVVLTSNPQWRALVELMQAPQLAQRYPGFAERAANREAINDAFAAWCAPQQTNACVDALLGVGVPAGPVKSPYDAPTDPQLLHRGALEALRHPDTNEPSPYLGPALPLRFSRGETGTTPAEPLGASTEAVLRDVLEMDAESLARLRESGALG
jgi:crotonobetainyl-CoA:carnitine CoA-transferase CaiB-like acyl-CoA transferase